MFDFLKKPSLIENEPLELVFIPALVLLLIQAEKAKKSALSQEEVEQIRDAGTCIAMPISLANKMEKERGYPDIDAENCWEDWSTHRVEYFSKPREFGWSEE